MKASLKAAAATMKNGGKSVSWTPDSSPPTRSPRSRPSRAIWSRKRRQNSIAAECRKQQATDHIRDTVIQQCLADGSLSGRPIIDVSEDFAETIRREARKAETSVQAVLEEAMSASRYALPTM